MNEVFISVESAEGDLLACAAFLAERIKSSDGHAEAMTAIIPRYLTSGDVDLSAELANAVDDPYSRDKLLILVAEKCAELDDDEYALQLADSVEDQGLQSQAYERIGQIKARQGNIAKAAEIAEVMAHPDFVYAGIAVRQAASGDPAAADATLAGIAFPTAKVGALQQMAAAAVEAEDYDKAVEILDRATATAGEIEHDEEKIRAFCDIGNHFLEAKRNDKAIETFDAARALTEQLDNTHRDFFFVNCALGFLYSGSLELADRTLDLVNDKTQMASALVGFSRESWRKDEKEDALETLDEAYEILKSQRETETRDSRGRNTLHASIGAQFAGYGKTDRGIEIALENQDPNEEMAALTQIAQILTVQKEEELARQTVEMIREDPNRLFALVGMGDEKVRQGEDSAAITLFEEAATLSETIPQLGSRSNILNEIAARLVERGRPEKARELLLENLSVIAQIRDQSSQAATLASLADVYVLAGFEVSEEERQYLRQFVMSTAS
ncbi:hypothetical protein BH10ACI3_BH10ACI3_13230 [soil metagenome]